MIGCIISLQLFVLVMEIKFLSAEGNTNEITGSSIKSFFYDVTLVTESRSHMEQLMALI